MPYAPTGSGAGPYNRWGVRVLLGVTVRVDLVAALRVGGVGVQVIVCHEVVVGRVWLRPPLGVLAVPQTAPGAVGVLRVLGDATAPPERVRHGVRLPLRH